MDKSRNITIAQIQESILSFAIERDWLQFHSPKNLAMAIAIEAGELMEQFLCVSDADSSSLSESNEKRDAIEQELADVLIYTLQLANVLKIDVESAIDNKLQINAERYPIDRSKGSSAKYTELQ